MFLIKYLIMINIEILLYFIILFNVPIIEKKDKIFC